MGTSRRSRRTRSSAARSIIETLETRQLLTVFLTNGLDPASPDFFQVEMAGAGSTRNTELGADHTDTIYDYYSYLDTGDGHVYNLKDYGANPQFQSIGKATDQVVLNLANGGKITINITSELPRGSKTLVNTYQFSATGYDLRNAKFYQYMDADIDSVSDDVLTVSGSIATGDLVLTTVDPATSKRQAQSPGAMTSGAYLSGWGADSYADLRDEIEAGGYNPAAAGAINTVNLPPVIQAGVGSGWGPGDITTTLTYKFTSISQAALSTVLGVRDLQMKRPVIILPDFMGSMPTQDTWGSFLTEFANGQGHSPTSLTADPMLAAYEPLMRLMDDTLGYDRNVDLFFGAYDWRRPIAPTDGVNDGQLHLSGVNFTDGSYQYGVEYLRYWIEQARSRWSSLHAGSTAGFSVDIVGHGMGGLIARAFMQSDYFQANYAGQVNRVVTLGTPNEGLVDAYLWLEPGIGPDRVAQQATTLTSQADLVSVAQMQLLWRMARDVNGSGLSIGAAIPSLYNLTPTFSFVTSNGGAAPAQDAYRNALLLDLNSDPSSFVTRAAGGVVLAGSRGTSTPAGVVYGPAGASVLFSTDGDGQVLWSSATLAHGRPGGANVPTVYTARHVALFAATPLQTAIVRSYLDLSTPSDLGVIAHPWLESATSYTFGYLGSVDFILTNSQGQRLGYTSTYGYLNEMPGAYYSGSGSYELFLIPQIEQVGDVNLALQGVGSNYTGSVERMSLGGTSEQSVSGYLGANTSRQVTVVEPPLPFGLVLGKPTKQVITEADGDRITFDLVGGGTAQLYGVQTQNYEITLSGTTAASTLKITVLRGANGNGTIDIAKITSYGLLKAITAPGVFITNELVLNSAMALVPAAANVSITLAGLRNANLKTNGLAIKTLTLLDWSGGGELRASSVGTLAIKGRKDDPKTTATEWLAGNCDAAITLQGNPAAITLKTMNVLGRINGTITTNGGVGKVTAASFGGQLNALYLQSLTTKDKTATNGGTIVAQGADAKGSSIGTISMAGKLATGSIAANGKMKALTVAGEVRNTRIQSTGSVDAVTVGALYSSDVLVGVAASFGNRFAGSSLNYTGSAGGAGGAGAVLKAFTVKGGGYAPGQAPGLITDSNISAANMGTVSLKDTDPAGLKLWYLYGHAGSPKQVTYTDPNVKGNSFTWRNGQSEPTQAPDLLNAVM